MSLLLERTLAVGGTWVAAVVSQAVHQHATDTHLALTAERRPVAILIGSGKQLTAFTTAGEPLTTEEVERMFPGVTAKFLRSQPIAQASGPVGGDWA